MHCSISLLRLGFLLSYSWVFIPARTGLRMLWDGFWLCSLICDVSSRKGEHNVTGASVLAKIKRLKIFSPACRAVLPTLGQGLRKLQSYVFMEGFNFSCYLMTVHIHKVLSMSPCVQIRLSVLILAVIFVFSISYHLGIMKLSTLYLWELFLPHIKPYIVMLVSAM